MMSCRRARDGGRLGRRRASALFGVMVVMVLAALMCLATLNVSTSETKSASAARRRLAALFVAESGIERQIAHIRELQRKSLLNPAFQGIDLLEGRTTFTNEPLIKDGQQVGQYTVQVPMVEKVEIYTRRVTIISTGCVPWAGAPNVQQRRITAVIQVKLVRSNLFDYVYFMHNWGSIKSDKIYVDGNVRSNGHFDFGTCKAKVEGVPRFESVDGEDLQGYLDDNGDGVIGNDGGIYATWDIFADDVFGMAGLMWSEGDASAGRCDPSDVGDFVNQHEWLPYLPMPNLGNFNVYEETAKAKGSWIKVGDTVVCGPVLGDEPGEKRHLYLKGTVAEPIWINGPVVVRGSVVVSGVVKGEGVIYAAGNIYVPQNLQYVNPPQPLPRPGSRNESELENWLLHNKYDCDFLGLFARGHVVVGDYTDADWRSSIATSLAVPENMTKEDAGIDTVPNTRDGRDGIPGTADDDALEGDGVWSVERYTEEDAQTGVIPPGFNVGDVVPGSGEDIDGDGVYDGHVSLSQFDLPAPLSGVSWAGNLPDGVSSYASISSTAIARLDAAFYSNHVFAMATFADKSHFEINGCILARNEALTYDTKDLILNYDYRLMAGDQFGFDLPKCWAPVRTLLWRASY